MTIQFLRDREQNIKIVIAIILIPLITLCLVILMAVGAAIYQASDDHSTIICNKPLGVEFPTCYEVKIT